MLFNSYEFVFGFLPVALAGFWLLGARNRDWALLWLTLMSLVFYAWWRPVNVLLIAPSILINLGVARLLERHRETSPGVAKALLVGGVAFNLCFLGYFKYTMFLRGAVNDVFGTDLTIAHMILPLGISFITFQKIAFLVDVHGGRGTRFTLRDYALFVLFFPQLIAGPIVHYPEVTPQFRAASARFDPDNVAVGLSLFFMGLAKKLLFADPLGALIGPIYARAAHGGALGLIDAWVAGLGFTLQLYFDFSGYSDMALGLARLFGIKLPLNFNSPLRSTSIVEFWTRWHASLTRFLTAYIYTPLTLHLARRRRARGRPIAGGRHMTVATFLSLMAVPTMVTLFLSGVWHGAGYTFVVFGLMHGAMIVATHAWRLFAPRIWPDMNRHPRLLSTGGFLTTFVFVVVAFAMFRAPTLSGGLRVWADMIGTHGVSLPAGLLARLGSAGEMLSVFGVQPDATSGSLLIEAMARICVLLAVALFVPNTLEMMARFEPALGFEAEKTSSWLARRARWAPSPVWACGMAGVAAAGLLSLGQLTEFLYWQF